VDIITATALKALVMPVIAYLAAVQVSHLSDEFVFRSVLVAALPTGQNVFMIASRYGLGVATARDVVFISSAAAVPVLLVAAAFLV
jgi:malonate transporter